MLLPSLPLPSLLISSLRVAILLHPFTNVGIPVYSCIFGEAMTKTTVKEKNYVSVLHHAIKKVSIIIIIIIIIDDRESIIIIIITNQTYAQSKSSLQQIAQRQPHATSQ